MFVDLTNGSQSLCISFARATSLRQGVQGQQAQIILFLLKMCLGCPQNGSACLFGFHADTPGFHADTPSRNNGQLALLAEVHRYSL